MNPRRTAPEMSILLNMNLREQVVHDATEPVHIWRTKWRECRPLADAELEW